jgi:hypothetical protein
MPRIKLSGRPDPTLIGDDTRIQSLERGELEEDAAAGGTPDEFVEAINSLWNQAQRTFLRIGKLLIRAKDSLPHGTYVAEVEARLPFKERTAYQMREAAKWALEMDRRRTIPLRQLPGSYATIYVLSTLDPETLHAATAEGLIRPELSRSELVIWRRGRLSGTGDRERLEARRDHLLRARRKLDDELRRVELALNGVELRGIPVTP